MLVYQRLLDTIFRAKIPIFPWKNPTIRDLAIDRPGDGGIEQLVLVLASFFSGTEWGTLW